MYSCLESSRVFISGATGLIGTALCKELVRIGAHVVAFVRDPAKAAAKLPTEVEVVVGDMINPIVYPGRVDYILHAASETASRSFIERPVEVIEETLAGARHMLNLARQKSVKGMVFLSTMEVYGLADSKDVKETDYAALDPMLPRNCYPESKRLVECLCASAQKEYDLPIRIARLTQTFGPGVARGDKRVFAQFAEAILEGRDIVLKSEGKTARCYCSIDDAVSAILTILIDGVDGEVYNVANPDTFCTIREMAELVITKFGQNKSRVVIDTSNAKECGFLPTFRMKLNVEKLLNLGWRPTKGLEQMYKDMIDDMNKRS